MSEYFLGAPSPTTRLPMISTAPSDAIPTEPATSKFVYMRDGALVYSKVDNHTNVIPDFSTTGYRGGGVEIPLVEAKRMVYAQESGDDTTRIQSAIDEVAALTFDSNGFRGAVELGHGTFRVKGKLEITASGVVVRGQGQHYNGTTIIATGNTDRPLFEVHGSRSDSGPLIDELSSQRILQDYVPVGSFILSVSNSCEFSIGDDVVIHRPRQCLMDP